MACSVTKSSPESSAEEIATCARHLPFKKSSGAAARLALEGFLAL